MTRWRTGISGGVLPDVLVPLDVEAVEVVVLHQPLLLLLVLALLQALHDGQLHLHGDVDGQHGQQQALLRTHTHTHTHEHLQCTHTNKHPQYTHADM